MKLRWRKLKEMKMMHYLKKCGALGIFLICSFSSSFAQINESLFNKLTDGKEIGPKWHSHRDCVNRPDSNIWVFKNVNSSVVPAWANTKKSWCRQCRPYSFFFEPVTGKGKETSGEIKTFIEEEYEGQKLIKMIGEVFPEQETIKGQVTMTMYMKLQGDELKLIYGEILIESPSETTKKILRPEPSNPVSRYKCGSGTTANANLASLNESITGEKVEFLQHLFNMTQPLYLSVKTYERYREQWEFNTRFGAPPISKKHTRMVKQDVPAIYKAFSECSKKMGGPDITSATVEKYIMTSEDKDVVMTRKGLELLKIIEGEEKAVRTPKRSELNDVVDKEQMLSQVISQYKGLLKYDTDKNWCEKFFTNKY